MTNPHWVETHSTLEWNTHSPEEHPVACHLTSIEEEDEEEGEDAEEHLPNSIHWMMMFRWKNQSQTGTYAFRNIHKMICALTLGLYSLD